MENTEKILELERELEQLKRKVSSLEAGLIDAETRLNNMTAQQTVKPPVTTQAANSNPAATYRNPAAAYNNPAASQAPGSNINLTIPATQAPTQNQRAAYSYTNPAPQNMRTPAPRGSSNTESWIGKILMGVLASLLVFIALITFAKLLLPYVTDGIKIFLMFAASIALTGAGFALSKSKPQNTFFKALLACGSVCIYLSILVTGIHFKAINHIVMYVLIALWAILMIFLKKSKDDWLFFAIGNIGYFVSIIFTIGLSDEALIIPLLIYAAMVSAFYQIMHWKNERQREAQSIINVVVLLILHLIMTAMFGDMPNNYANGVVTMLWSFAGIAFYLLSDLRSYHRNHFYVAAVSSLTFIGSFFLMNIYLELPALISFLVILIPTAAIEVLCMYQRSIGMDRIGSHLNGVFTTFLFFCAAVTIAQDRNILFESGIIMIIYSLTAIYGFIKRDRFFKIQGWIMVGLCMSLGLSMDSGIFFALVALLLIICSLITEGFILNDSVLFKSLSYIVLLGWIAKIGELVSDLEPLESHGDVVSLVTYAVIAFISIILTLTHYHRTNEKSGGRNLHIIMDFLNLILIVAGAARMGNADDTPFKVAYMVIVFILACLNLPVKEKTSRERFLFAGIKLGILLFYSLCTFEAPSFVISICMIAFSVLCITIGFKNRLLGKELRIFGLLTTLVFVMKFIIFDISIDSTVMKAISYLIGGILCFGISAIYNHFEKTTAGVKIDVGK